MCKLFMISNILTQFTLSNSFSKLTKLICTSFPHCKTSLTQCPRYSNCISRPITFIIGSVMSATGLIEVLQCCRSSIVTHMMSVKAVSQSIHNHFLKESSLAILLLSNIFYSVDNENSLLQMQCKGRVL